MSSEDSKLIFEDDSIFVAEKPAGLHSVRGGAEGQPSLADLLLEKHPYLEHAAERAGDAGLVQRLDFGTSGMLIGAKDRTTWMLLREQLNQGEIYKEYLILVDGDFVGNRSVTSYIGSPYRSAKKVRVYPADPPRGHRALSGTTHFTQIESFREGRYSLVRAIASPARRHQVRAHAAHVGHPLIGDTLYGSHLSLLQLAGLARPFFLHAAYLRFRHPISDNQLEFISPSADELQQIRQRLNAS